MEPGVTIYQFDGLKFVIIPCQFLLKLEMKRNTEQTKNNETNENI
jgi:hypothetical protein